MLRGKWPTVDYPQIIHVAGREFRRAGWYWPYPNVKAQYRESKAQDSMHLFVLLDGTWIIPHVDDENPDLGNPIQHLLRDVLPPV
jgi:hypothetical protein